jgi:hypothetical protein
MQKTTCLSVVVNAPEYKSDLQVNCKEENWETIANRLLRRKLLFYVKCTCRDTPKVLNSSLLDIIPESATNISVYFEDNSLGLSARGVVISYNFISEVPCEIRVGIDNIRTSGYVVFKKDSKYCDANWNVHQGVIENEPLVYDLINKKPNNHVLSKAIVLAGGSVNPWDNTCGLDKISFHYAGGEKKHT